MKVTISGKRRTTQVRDTAESKASSADADRVARIARAEAYMNDTREQFSANVKTATERLNGRADGILAGPTVARR